MQSLDFEGKTIDEAIEKACREWQVSREKLSIEIITEGAAGFMGLLGGKKARIKASLLSLEETLNGNMAASPPAGAAPEARGNPALRAKELLEGILERMDLTCPVTVEETPESVILNIEGDGGGLLIGRRGQNLDALQYIINKAVHRLPYNHKTIVVDTESYRERRIESLNDLAAKIGERVKKTKKAVTLNYLNAHNRRIIHMALQNDQGLTTKSRGEGEYRKLIIVPTNKD
ncbi:MAG: RNA-binding cell elongation regulator Jag/EloR [Syntrophales bacterium]